MILSVLPFPKGLRCWNENNVGEPRFSFNLPVKSLETTNDNFCGIFGVICGKSRQISKHFNELQFRSSKIVLDIMGIFYYFRFIIIVSNEHTSISTLLHLHRGQSILCYFFLCTTHRTSTLHFCFKLVSFWTATNS